MRPLDRLDSIKIKLGVVILVTAAGTVVVLWAGRKLGLPLLVRGSLGCVLGLAMVQFLARGMTSPLREMAAAASAMARGDYGRRVRATSRDEVGDNRGGRMRQLAGIEVEQHVGTDRHRGAAVNTLLGAQWTHRRFERVDPRLQYPDRRGQLTRGEGRRRIREPRFPCDG